MAKSSINFAKASAGGLQHNDRTIVPNYLLQEEFRLENEYDISAQEAEKKIQNLYSAAKDNYQEKFGQKLQSKSYIWEAVINLNKEHILEDVQRLTKEIEKETGFTSVQVAIHRDEGRVEKSKDGEIIPIYNLHAHVTFFTLDKETGINLYRKDITPAQRNEIEKEIFDKHPNINKGEAGSEERKKFNKLVREKKESKNFKVMDTKRLSQLQTLTAKSLGMTRGKVSVKEEAERLGVEHDKNPTKRLEHKQYKQVQQQKELIKAKDLKEELKKARESLKDQGAKREDYAKLEKLNKELQKERKEKMLTKENLTLALKEVTELKSNINETATKNIEIKKDFNNTKDQLQKLNENHENLKKEHIELKEKYENLKEFIKEIPKKLLENAKNTYQEIIHKIDTFHKKDKNTNKIQKLEDLYKKQEQLKNQQERGKNL